MVNDNNEYMNLGDAAKKYPMLLMDTSSMIQFLSGENEIPRKITSKERAVFRKKLLNYLAGGINCFITPGVGREFPYVDKDIESNPDLSDRMKEIIIKDAAERIDLVKAFHEFDRVLNLNEGERYLYEKFNRDYSQVKIKYNLSGVDFDLLISGVVVMPSALVSTDFGIFEGLLDILAGENISIREFGFFIRTEFDRFKLAKVPYSENGTPLGRSKEFLAERYPKDKSKKTLRVKVKK